MSPLSLCYSFIGPSIETRLNIFTP
jgi:hypothetical protein